MSRLERLTLELPADLAQAIQAAVDVGDYASTSELATEALGAWVSQRQLEEQDLRALRAAYVEGKSSGASRPLDVESVIGRVRARSSATERD